MKGLATPPSLADLTDYQASVVRCFEESGDLVVGGINGMPVVECPNGLLAIPPKKAVHAAGKQLKAFFRVSLLRDRVMIG